MPSGPISLRSVFTDLWPDWIGLLVGVAVLVGYVVLRVRLTERWTWGRDVMFAVGMVLWFYAVAGFPQARSSQLMWVWTSQQLLLFLIVPIFVLAGQPLALLRRTRGERSLVLRAFGSPPVRVLGHPLVGPALVPIVCFSLFFTPIGNAAASDAVAGGLLHLLLLGLGALVALPLVDTDDKRTSLAIGLSLGVGIIELILDAFPGIVLRFHTHLVMPHFGVDRPPWSPDWRPDQQLSGSILWVVAEVLDLPFLILAATRWVRADAKEAAQVDAALEAKRQALRPAEEVDDPDAPVLDRPWWEDDSQLRERFSR